MSLQESDSKSEVPDVSVESAKHTSTFEKHIIQCCKASEWDLRNWLRKTLTRAGFTITEDKYKTERCDFSKKYETVHNMLAVRGTPKVCLVSHTDVCREHDEARSNSHRFKSEYPAEYKKYYGEEEEEEKHVVDPVVKKVKDDEGVVRRIIQDRHRKLQTGGDDRLGVAIITWIALNTGYDMGLFFPTDEEIGLKSAAACEMKELLDFDLLVEVDRGNHSNELVTKIGNTYLCGWETGTRLLEIAFDMGIPRTPVTGMGTDVAALISRGKAKEAVNMTCGYHESHSSSPDEYIEVAEAMDTMRYVSSIVKSYYIESKTE